MKKTFITLMIALMSVFVSTQAYATTSNNVKEDYSEVLSLVKDIIVKQTITLTDGTQVEIFYQKTGNLCKVYSSDNLKKYSAKDLKRIKSTSFEIVNHTEGKCYLTEDASGMMRIARNIFDLIR